LPCDRCAECRTAHPANRNDPPMLAQNSPDIGDREFAIANHSCPFLFRDRAARQLPRTLGWSPRKDCRYHSMMNNLQLPSLLGARTKRSLPPGFTSRKGSFLSKISQKWGQLFKNPAHRQFGNRFRGLECVPGVLHPCAQPSLTRGPTPANQASLIVPTSRRTGIKVRVF